MAKGDRKRALRGRAGRMQGGRGSGRATSGHVRLWGRHAVEAALKNPARQHRKLWATRDGIESLDGELPPDFPVEYADVQDLARLVAKDTPHQGLVLECLPLEDVFLDEVLDGEAGRPIVVLDQVTDPHNVGAILRSAAAFDAGAVVMTRRNSPPLDGALAKAASGALEHVPVLLVANLARTLDELGRRGVLRIGLDGDAGQTLETAEISHPCALILGAEHRGLRRLTSENCDLLCRLTTTGPLSSLNVSNAAAVALHAVATRP